MNTKKLPTIKYIKGLCELMHEYHINDMIIPDTIQLHKSGSSYVPKILSEDEPITTDSFDLPTSIDELDKLVSE